MRKYGKKCNAAVLWTGGKDSALAMHEAQRAGCNITLLVTFAPPNETFLAHPLPFIRKQAAAIGLPHRVIRVRAPFRRGYEKGIRLLMEKNDIGTLITGDIAEVGGQPNWIRQCAEPLGVEVLTPLWGRDRLALLKRLLTLKFRIIFSCVKKPWLTPRWAGRLINEKAVAELRDLRKKNGIDLCGENGEYHTLTLDGPMFQRRLRIVLSSRRTKNEMTFLEFCC